MRKGADCLSKWVGEAERQLRLLFEQAHKMQPAIIFFVSADRKFRFRTRCDTCNLDSHFPSFLFFSSSGRNRWPCSCSQLPSGSDPCFHRFHVIGAHGRTRFTRTSHCYWSHKSPGFHRSGSATTRQIRPRAGLLTAKQNRSARDPSDPHSELESTSCT
jgi:hypothetical protein